MLKIAMIRHFMTYGNQMGRYIGTTDEPLSKEGIDLLNNKHYPVVQMVYSSPLRRCIQTNSILYPNNKYRIIEDLKECDFGEFENKNYKELSDNINYQAWIDSNGELPFPGGETRNDFRKRCIKGFKKVVEDAIINKYDSIALVIHGGTIMSILDEYISSNEDFYRWQVKNGEGYLVELSQDNRGFQITIIGKLPLK